MFKKKEMNTNNHSQNSLGKIEILEEKKKKNRSILILIALVALVITGVFGYLLLGNNLANTPLSKRETVVLGKYEGKNIEWIVIDKKSDGSKLLLSKKVLTKQAYNTVQTNISWETSDVRSWLNSSFYNSAFSKKEKSKIKKTKCSNKKNEEYGTSAGKTTNDYVFLLSSEEAHRYFSKDEYRSAKNLKGNRTWYWLRTPGVTKAYATFVSDAGYVIDGGIEVERSYGIRPAIWIKG